MIVDKPIENMNKNYESYLQLDQVRSYSMPLLSAPYPCVAQRGGASRSPCSNILNSFLNPRIRGCQEVINVTINAPQYYKL